MSEKMFSREQYEQLRSFPEISRDELFRHFTLTPADAAFVDPGAGRGSADRLGMAVQLTTLPWLGFVPGDHHRDLTRLTAAIRTELDSAARTINATLSMIDKHPYNA